MSWHDDANYPGYKMEVKRPCHRFLESAYECSLDARSEDIEKFCFLARQTYECSLDTYSKKSQEFDCCAHQTYECSLDTWCQLELRAKEW